VLCELNKIMGLSLNNGGFCETYEFCKTYESYKFYKTYKFCKFDKKCQKHVIFVHFVYFVETLKSR
jgi:hypothetical protein